MEALQGHAKALVKKPQGLGLASPIHLGGKSGRMKTHLSLEIPEMSAQGKKIKVFFSLGARAREPSALAPSSLTMLRSSTK
jgi:hypothetical protein